MTHRQLILLFVAFFIPSAVGNAIMSLMSLYARSLGADAAQTGGWLALAFLTLALTTIGSSRLSRRFQRRKAFITLAAPAGVPFALLMGWAQDMTQLGVFTIVLWGLYGIATTMTTMLTGLYADEARRGQIFGMMGVGLAVGQVIGGFAAGALVERWGFTALFVYAAVLFAGLTLTSLGLEDKRQPEQTPERIPGRAAALLPAARRSLPLNGAFLFILIASVLAFSGSFVSEMVRPLIMDARNFAPSVISGTVAISGIVNLPLPFLMGWLSDRMGRRRLLLACYGLAAMGVLMTIPASAAWHFWIAQAFIVLVTSGMSLGSALVTDLVEPQALESSLAWFSATRWIGAVVSFAGAGVLVEGLGFSVTLALTAGLVLAAIPLVRAACSPRLHAPTACQPAAAAM